MKIWKVLAAVALVAALGFTTVGCGDDEYSIRFVNGSSYVLLIEGETLSPKSFSLAVGKSRTVTSSTETVEFTAKYAGDPDSVVYIFANGTVTFSDK